MKFLFIIFKLLIWCAYAFCRQQRGPTELRMSAGEKGWETILLKEFYLSAAEWLAPNQVSRVVYTESLSVRQEVGNCSHFFYDARTGLDRSKGKLGRTLSCYFRAIKIGFVTAVRGITVIAWVTDFSDRNLRVAAFLATAARGQIVTAMSPHTVPPRFLFHPRVFGPVPMPFSLKTIQSVDGDIWKGRRTLISFTGALYEPRTSFFKEVSERCEAHGLKFLLNDRMPLGERTSDCAYWQDLTNSIFTIATCSQQPPLKGDSVDFPEIKHMVGRITEAAVAGCCLLSDIPPGIECLFKPHKHFVPVSTPSDVINVLLDYPNRPRFYEKIARAGRRRAEALAETSFLWSSVNTALGKHSMM